MFDSESSVVNKLASAVHELIFTSIIQWAENNKNNNKNNKNNNNNNNNNNNLGWQLTNKIQLFGFFKIFKSIISTCVKQV